MLMELIFSMYSLIINILKDPQKLTLVQPVVDRLDLTLIYTTVVKYV